MLFTHILQAGHSQPQAYTQATVYACFCTSVRTARVPFSALYIKQPVLLTFARKIFIERLGPRYAFVLPQDDRARSDLDRNPTRWPSILTS